MITFGGNGSREGKRNPEFVLHDHKADLSEPVACTIADAPSLLFCIHQHTLWTTWSGFRFVASNLSNPMLSGPAYPLGKYRGK